MSPLEILKKYWGYTSFRAPQREIIKTVLQSKNILVLLPTGGGKSLCYQVPSLCTNGLCLVVSPLLALIKDQVENLKKRGIKAYALSGDMSIREINIALDNCTYGNAKFLYISPEKLSSHFFQERIKAVDINFLAVDEAHCISQWGHDFRPAYREIGKFIQENNIKSTIALTATATPKVCQDIIQNLELTNVSIFRKSFAKPNLFYSCIKTENKIQKAHELLAITPKKSSIIYVNSRKKTKQVAHNLKLLGYRTGFYHGLLDSQTRILKQDAWIKKEIQIIVCTNAFGMGIDKSDVRNVIHMDIPFSLESYYQEAGRAGRDNKKSYATLLYSDKDLVDLIQKTKNKIFTVKELRETYGKLVNYLRIPSGAYSDNVYTLDVDNFMTRLAFPIKKLDLLLKHLKNQEIIDFSDASIQKSKLKIIVTLPDLKAFARRNQSFQSIIYGLLRLYGGHLFSEFYTVDEEQIASFSNKKKDQIIKKLTYLHQLKFLHYEPKTSNLKLQFLTTRANPTHLRLDEKKLIDYQKNLVQKSEDMKRFILSKKCRSLFIQHYFGEKTNVICHHCDNDRYIGDTSIEIEKLYQYIQSGPKNFTQIQKKWDNTLSEELQKYIRLLIEDNKIILKGNYFKSQVIQK